jgi:AcrR family transcriptional regulator
MSRPSRQPELRVDAERNRAQILEAARVAFAERGIDVPMEEIARRAGVGKATLYRRFPTRGVLIAEAFEEKMRAYAEGVENALADPDPWSGFGRYVQRLCLMQSADRGFSEVLTLTFPTAKVFEADRRRAYSGFKKLIKRAKASGSLRADFAPDDLIMLLVANAGVLAATSETAPRMSPRLIAYLLEAFAAPGRNELPPPPSPGQTYQSLLRLGEERTETGAAGTGLRRRAHRAPDQSA